MGGSPTCPHEVWDFGEVGFPFIKWNKISPQHLTPKFLSIFQEAQEMESRQEHSFCRSAGLGPAEGLERQMLEYQALGE